jgi:twinkle protein
MAVYRIYDAAGNPEEIDLESYEPPHAAKIIFCHQDEILDEALAAIKIDDLRFGAAMPWPKTHERMRFRPGEVSAWIGPNGDGKSLLTGFLMAHWATQEQRCLTLSLEMSIRMQLKRILRQLACSEKITRETAIDLTIRRLGNWMAFLDHVGHIDPDETVRLLDFAIRRMKFEHVLIDNLTMICPPSRENDEKSSRFVADLVRIARETGCHIHLVGHIRKPDDDRRLTRYDWRGTGATVDMVHNVVIVQRNMKKARAEEEGVFSDDPDCWLIVDKQRNAEFTGKFGFWFRSPSLRLVESLVDHPQPYV